MNCKYCASPLNEGETICPACGKNQAAGEVTAFAEGASALEANEEALPAQEASAAEASSAFLTEEADETTKDSQEPAAQTDAPLPQEEDKPGRKRSKGIWAVAALIAAAALVAGVYYFTGIKPATTPAAAENRTMVSYSTGRELKTTAGSQKQPVSLFINDAYSLSAYSSIDQLMQQSPVYVGYQNYVEMEQEVVYVDTVIQSVDSAAGQVSSHNLYTMAYGGEPVLLDSGVQAIQAGGKDFVYYNKVENNQITQYRYADGKITNVNQELGVDHAMITTCSRDGKVFGFRGAMNSADGSMTTANGYVENGTVHLLEQPTATAYYVSLDGSMIYITDTANSPAPSLSYVADLASGALEEISPYITEVIFYEDTGSAAYIGGREIGEDEINPSCNLGYFDAANKTHHVISQDAVALVEADAKSYAWLNENTKEMFVTELSRKISVPSAAKAGQFHYINAAGDLMAADMEGNSFTVAVGFYSPDSYTLAQGLYYPTFQNGAFLWNNGDTVYKYTAGSMTDPQTITLDTPLSEKLSGSLQVGYFMDGSGNLIEQTENTLVKKSFESDNVFSVYDSQSAFIIVGLNPAGDSFYFISGDGSLYEKSLKDTSNPKPIASQVHSAIAVTDGLYVLREYGVNGAAGGQLEFQAWGEKGFSLVESNVLSLTDVVLD